MRLYPIRPYRGASLKHAPKGAKVKTSVVQVQLFSTGIMIIFQEHSGQGAQHIYTYTYDSCGAAIDDMKDLAKAGAGLNRYINAHKPPYDESGQTPTELEMEESLSYSGD